MSKTIKPNLSFLRKVLEGKVAAYDSFFKGITYSGGEKTWRAQAAAGYCTAPGAVRFSQPSRAMLTQAGSAALAQAKEGGS